jgi:hypothetical protein
MAPDLPSPHPPGVPQRRSDQPKISHAETDTVDPELAVLLDAPGHRHAQVGDGGAGVGEAQLGVIAIGSRCSKASLR